VPFDNLGSGQLAVASELSAFEEALEIAAQLSGEMAAHAITRDQAGMQCHSSHNHCKMLQHAILHVYIHHSPHDCCMMLAV
jgi:hypothetical protein